MTEPEPTEVTGGALPLGHGVAARLGWHARLTSRRGGRVVGRLAVSGRGFARRIGRPLSSRGAHPMPTSLAPRDQVVDHARREPAVAPPAHADLAHPGRARAGQLRFAAALSSHAIEERFRRTSGAVPDAPVPSEPPPGVLPRASLRSLTDTAPGSFAERLRAEALPIRVAPEVASVGQIGPDKAGHSVPDADAGGAGSPGPPASSAAAPRSSPALATLAHRVLLRYVPDADTRPRKVRPPEPEPRPKPERLVQPPAATSTDEAAEQPAAPPRTKRPSARPQKKAASPPPRSSQRAKAATSKPASRALQPKAPTPKPPARAAQKADAPTAKTPAIPPAKPPVRAAEKRKSPTPKLSARAPRDPKAPAPKPPAPPARAPRAPTPKPPAQVAQPAAPKPPARSPRPTPQATRTSTPKPTTKKTRAFVGELERRGPDRMVALPQRFEPLARALGVTGPVAMRTGPAAAAALETLRRPAATFDGVVHLARSPGNDARSAAMIAHELVHVSASRRRGASGMRAPGETERPRLFGDDEVDPEELLARQVGSRVREAVEGGGGQPGTRRRPRVAPGSSPLAMTRMAGRTQPSSRGRSRSGVAVSEHRRPDGGTGAQGAVAPNEGGSEHPTPEPQVLDLLGRLHGEGAAGPRRGAGQSPKEGGSGAWSGRMAPSQPQPARGLAGGHRASGGGTGQPPKEGRSGAWSGRTAPSQNQPARGLAGAHRPPAAPSASGASGARSPFPGAPAGAGTGGAPNRGMLSRLRAALLLDSGSRHVPAHGEGAGNVEPEHPVPGTSSATEDADILEWIVEQVERRVLAELERRGRRHVPEVF